MRAFERTQLALLGGVLISVVACQESGGDVEVVVVPAEIQGSWVTSEPKYADRAFEILEESLIFHTGEGGWTLNKYRTISVETDVEDVEGTLYQIEYLGPEGGLFTFSVVLRPADGTIIFLNQPDIIWTRGTAPPLYRP
jgi:hypothetical protein